MHEDVFLDLEFNIKADTYKIVATNIKENLVENFVEEFIHSQIGAGSDKSQPVEKDVYTIHIGLDMSDDTFSVKSDTGNKSLTTGIVAHFLHKTNTSKNSMVEGS
jgi:hypothetical protein